MTYNSFDNGLNKKKPSFTPFQIKTYWGILLGYSTLEGRILPFKVEYNKIRNIFHILGFKMQLQELGQEIKILRKQKNWSQNDLEHYSGIKKVDMILDLLGVEFCTRVKGRPRTLEELQNELENK